MPSASRIGTDSRHPQLPADQKGEEKAWEFNVLLAFQQLFDKLHFHKIGVILILLDIDEVKAVEIDFARIDLQPL